MFWSITGVCLARSDHLRGSTRVDGIKEWQLQYISSLLICLCQAPVQVVNRGTTKLNKISPWMKRMKSDY